MDLFDASKNYYAILGLAKECEVNAIKAAFRKLARQYHPDVSNHPLAKSRFQEVSEAYEVLSRHRDSYDEAVSALRQAAAESVTARQRQATSNYRSNPPPRPSSQQPSAFSQPQARPQRQYGQAIDGRDRIMAYPVTLKYAFHLLKQGHFYIPSLDMRIPFDSSSIAGQETRFAGKGFPGMFGGKAGDYIISFKISHHAFFEIRGSDLHLQLKISRNVYTRGGDVYFDAPSGLLKVKIPPMIKLGSVMRFPNKGLPADRYQTGGHLYAKIILEG